MKLRIINKLSESLLNSDSKRRVHAGKVKIRKNDAELPKDIQELIGIASGIEDREGCQDAATILLCQKKQKCSLYLSSLTMANIAYILRKKFKGIALYNALNKLKVFFSVVLKEYLDI